MTLTFFLSHKHGVLFGTWFWQNWEQMYAASVTPQNHKIRSGLTAIESIDQSFNNAQ